MPYPKCQFPPRRGPAAWLLLLCLVLSSPLKADFLVQSGQTNLEPGGLVNTIRSSLSLSDEVTEALNSGIELHMVFQFRLFRIRPFIWDDRLGEWNVGYRLKYHALSAGYVLLNETNEELETFLSIRDAMESLQNLTIRLPVITETLPETEHGYRMSLRILMNTEMLPSPLKLVTEISGAWKLDSEWAQWTVED